jgi:RNA polymerase sigma-70 factor (ECF subfamily)
VSALHPDLEALLPWLEREAARLARKAGLADYAEDAAQEAAIRAWQRWESFDPDKGSLKAWLHFQVRAVLSNERDRRNARPRTVQLTQQMVDQGGVWDENRPGVFRPIAGLRTDFEPDVITEDERDRQLNEVKRLIACLPNHQARAVELHYLEGLTYKDVAIKLDIPEGTVRSRINRAMRELRALGNPSIK